MKRTKILIVCSKGRNRSKYLAEYLRKKGYLTRYGGIEKYKEPDKKSKLITQKDIDWADIIIVVRPRLKKSIKDKFKSENKKIIVLDISDSKRLIPKEYAHLKDLDYKTFQKKWTRPQLRKAIKPYLPLKK